MSDLPPLPPQFADSIYQELGSMDVQLDPDPLQFGPKRLNLKTALLRKYLSRLEAIFLDLSQQQGRYKRALRSATFVLEQARKDLFANNPHVRAGRAVSERTAIADGMLADDVQMVALYQDAVEDLETVIGLVKVKRSDLKDVQGRLRDQLKICQEEIGLGARWGSKSPRGKELEPGQGFATAEDSQSVEDAFADVLSEIRNPTPEETMLPISEEPEEVDETEEDREALLKSAFSVPPPNPPPPSTPSDPGQGAIEDFLSSPTLGPPRAWAAPFSSPGPAQLVDSGVDLDSILSLAGVFGEES